MDGVPISGLRDGCFLLKNRSKQVPSKPNAQSDRTEAKPYHRRVYINQRILRIRDETKALQEELLELRQAPGGSAAKDPKTTHKRIYVRERLAVLRDETRSLTAERQAMPKKSSPLEPEPPVMTRQ